MNKKNICSVVSTYPKTVNIDTIIIIVNIGKNRNLSHSDSTSLSADFFPNFFLIQQFTTF